MWNEIGLVGISTAVFFISSYEFGKRSARYTLSKSLKELEEHKRLIDLSIEEHKNLMDEISSLNYR